MSLPAADPDLPARIAFGERRFAPQARYVMAREPHTLPFPFGRAPGRATYTNVR